MSLNINLNLINITKQLIKETYYASEEAYRFLFEDSHDQKREVISGLLINKAISSYNCLRAFYYSNLNELEDYRVDNILNKFSLFSNEFLNNISTNHSHQWTSSEFYSFKAAVSVLIENID